jgi:cytochrome c oxidase subunit 3
LEHNKLIIIIKMFLNFKVLNIVLNDFSNFFNLNILWYKKNIGNIISNNSSLNINTLLIWKTSKINKKEVCNSISGTPLPLHPYHLVDQSPWPLALSGVLLSLTISAVLSFHGYVMGDFLLTCSFVLLVWGMSLWFKDIISEASYLGAHTDKVQKGISLGIVLFIISEVFFFLSIFWAYFHSSLAPAIELGGEWPPKGIEPVDASEVPTANTTILLSSGSAVTVSHHSLVNQLIDWANYGSVATIILAILFTGLQVLEYLGVSYTITDSVFGSTFFMATGFHGSIMLPLFLIIIFVITQLTNIVFYNWTFLKLNKKIVNNINNNNLILIDKYNNKF